MPPKKRRRGQARKTDKYEDRVRKKLFRKFLLYTMIVTNFSVPATFLLSIYLGNMLLFYCFLAVLPLYFGTYILNQWTFKLRRIYWRTSFLILLLIISAMMWVLTYIAGGYSGAMISGFLSLILMGALFLEEERSMALSALILFVYLSFFFAEELGYYTPLITDPLTLKYSKGIIDFIMILMILLLVPQLAKNLEDSINFYRLRGVRLKKKREELENLVKERTKQLEASNRRLKELDKKKDEFISIASHELQTPMASIYGFSDLLMGKRIFNDRKKREKYLKIIRNETKRMSKMVKDMLNLSRIDMGTLKFDVEDIDVNNTLEELQLELEGAASKKNLKLTIHRSKPLPKMRADKEKLRQILINLIVNSVKYTDRGSITVDAKKRGKYIEFSVADTGIGIPKNEQVKIFERFYQVESPHTRKALGAGLGLSIVKEYVKNMRGKMWLESRVGKGTTFYFTLPIKFTPSKRTYVPKKK
jgi:signal transduction histidine kinase